MPAPVDVDTMGQPIDSLSREERVRRRAEEQIREAEERAVDAVSEDSLPASDPPAH
jgi:hypothetical protein